MTRHERNVTRLRHTHALLTTAWLAMVPIALITGWITSIAFVSACSIYANAIGHWSAWQASRAESQAS